jgi:D-3-phosphoglycerate dehydrogenase
MLDVFDQEPLPEDAPIRKAPNAFLSPHRAGGIMESVARILDMLADDYEAFLQGQPLKYALTESQLTALPG